MQPIGGVLMSRRWKCESNTSLSLLYTQVIYESVSLVVRSKDVRLPREMQRAMAAEAEATREASAKVHLQTPGKHFSIFPASRLSRPKESSMPPVL